MALCIDGRRSAGGVVECCAVGCLNKQENNLRVSFFKFPSDRARCKTWLINCGRSDLDAKFQSDPLFPSRNCWLCGDHFEQSQFVSANKTRLIRQALPTLFSDVRSCDSHVDSHVEITEDTDLMTDSSQHCVNSDLTQDYTNYCSDHCTENMEETEGWLSSVDKVRNIVSQLSSELAEKCDTLSEARANSITSLVGKLMGSLVECSDEKFSEHVAIISKLLEVWSEGDDVELRCNEPPQLVTAQLSADDVRLLANSQNAPVYVQFAFSKDVPDKNVVDPSSQQFSSVYSKQASTYRQPALPRRKPGDVVVPLVCNICGRKFRFHSQLEQHQKHHAGVRPYACHICGRRFAVSCSLDKHLTIHSHEKPLMCDTCGQRFAHINYLKSHQRTHSQDRPYACQECQKKFAHATSLRNHVAAMHTAAGAREQFTCHQCGRGFPTMSQVRVHVRSHVMADSLECQTCGAACDTAAALKQHVNTVHGVITGVSDARRQYRCGVCGRVFSQPGNLRRHAQTHAAQRPCECSVCGKRFSQPGNLKVHLRTHSGQRPYTCVGCGSSFTDASTLRKHVLHHCYVNQQLTADTLDTMTVSTLLTDSVNCSVDDIAVCSFV